MESLKHADYFPHLSRTLLKYRERSQYCDVILSVGGVEFTAHKMILSMNSAYFEAMFNGHFPESKQRTVELHGLESTVFGIVLQYMYTGEIKLEANTVIEIFKTADFFQLDWLRRECIEYIGKMVEISNCVSLWKFSELYGIKEIKFFTENFIVSNMDKVARTADYLALEVDDVTKLLCLEEINRWANESIYNIIMRWIKYYTDERKEHLPRLLKHLSTDSIHQSFLDTVILKEKLLRENTACTNWLLDNFTLVQKCLPNRRGCNGSPMGTGVAQKGYLFILNSSSNFYSYNIRKKALSTLSKRPLSQGFSVTAYKGGIYLLGGKRTRTGLKYHINTNIWETIEFRCYISSHAASEEGDFVYFTGGYSDGSWQNSVFRYDFGRVKMDKQARMMMKRGFHGSAAHRNCIYACGGTNSAGGGICELSLSERMDVREGMWTLLPTMQYRHGNCTAAIVSDAIYCSNTFGGITERFDVRRCNWEQIASPPGEVGSIVACDDRLYRVHAGGIAIYCTDSNLWYNIESFAFDSPTAVSF